MKTYLITPLLFLVLHTFSLPVIAQEEEAAQHHTTELEQEQSLSPWDVEHEKPGITIEHVEHEADTFQAKFLNMLFILGLLIGFMILASWTLKRMMKSRISQLNVGSTIKISETRSLSPRSTLYLVEVNGQNILIAETQTTITQLASWPVEEEIELNN
jgi:flagellar protein FliO/FliZ